MKLIYSGGEYPLDMVILKKTDNPWLKAWDTIYSIYEIDGIYYASWGVTLKNGVNVIAKVFKDTGELPVKTGISVGQEVMWCVERDGVVYLLNITEMYSDGGIHCGKFSMSNITIELKDNPYYSLSPVWPDNTSLRIKIPQPNKAFTLYQLQFTEGNDYRLQMPKFIENLQWIKIGGDVVINTNKYLNSFLFKFSNFDIANGSINVKMQGTALKNSSSSDTSRIYNIYWNFK